MCERDVGLFSLIQQVIANIPWAEAEGRRPVVYFGARTCYWTANTYRARDTVWEYYFEPVVPELPAAAIPRRTRSRIAVAPPSAFDVGYFAENGDFVTAHFGDAAELAGKALAIPYLLEDPDDALRRRTAAIIRDYVRPRPEIVEQAERFWTDRMADRPMIGVHIRGTDAISDNELRPHRKGSLQLGVYRQEIERLLTEHPSAGILVASDAQSSLDAVRDAFGDRVVSFACIRHEEGEAASSGPTGWIMPAYIAGNRDVAARSGEEAVIEYLLLARCLHLVHNGSGLARTVLLKEPDIPHTNTHRPPGPAGRLLKRRPMRDDSGDAPRVDPNLIARVKVSKAARLASPFKYRDRARVSLIVHSFNRVSNVDQIAAGLRRIESHELIVCDDGSEDGSREKWAAHLDRPNDFLILSNDLHEVRILDRAIRFASADIVCLIQDDDMIPGDTAWLDRGLEEFRRHPALAILGGFMGFHGFEHEDEIDCVWGPAPFRFVDHVNIGPYFIRRSHYEALGGWDFSFSKVGEPGICFDNEICLRAWLRGFRVGYRFVPFKGPPEVYRADGGTVLFSNEIRVRNQFRNHRKICALYGRHKGRIAEMVRDANRSIGYRAALR